LLHGFVNFAGDQKAVDFQHWRRFDPLVGLGIELLMKRLLVLALALWLAGHGWAADYAQAGALARNGKWEVGVVFDPAVTRNSAVNIANYRVSGGQEIESLRYVLLNHSVVLTVPGLLANASYSVTLTNLQNTSGQTLPALGLGFTTRELAWAAVGGQELGFAPDAVAVLEDGFDIISGGAEFWSVYDESTFVCERVTGDFDKIVRVLGQEPSSVLARAGLMAREALDEGRARPADPEDPAEAFSRYLQVQVNPVLAVYEDEPGVPLPGNNLHQVNARFFTGGIGSPNFDATENPSIAANAAPAYPEAWLRLRRVGQTFHAYRGTNATNWIQLGSFIFPTRDANGNAVPPFPETVFVGPNYSPETANIPESSRARRAFLARFRDYGNGPEAGGGEPVEPPALDIRREGDEIVVTWSRGAIQFSGDLTNWTSVPVVSPLRTIPDKRLQFFRVRAAE